MSSQPTAGPPRQLVFGPFTFDEASGELRKHGIRMRLEGQPLQILAALIRQPSQLVTRDEFQKQLWKGGTFVDFNHGLNAAMNRLRQVLGDSADHPRYIETMPGRGYRFIAAIQETASKPVLVMTPPAVPEPAKRKAWPLWFIAAGLILASAGGYLALHRRPTPVAQPLRFSISPPDGFALEAASSRQTFALSPDGARIAFTASDSSGRSQTFIRDLNGLESRPVANSTGSYHVFWAPDSRSLFLTVRGSLRRTTLDSDSYQVICDAPPMMLTAALSGSNLLISGRSNNFTVPASGGTPQATKELYPWPQVLPDGQHLLYTGFDAQSGHYRAQVITPGVPESARVLVETDSRAMYTPSLRKPETGYLVYVRAGNILAQPFDPRSLRIQGEPRALVFQTYSFAGTGAADFSVSDNGVLAYRRYKAQSQLAWVNRQGEVMSTIGPANVNLRQGRLSPDGTKIATPIYDVSRGVNDIWIIEAHSGAARRLMVGRGQPDNPVWSPDSTRLVFNRAYDTPPKLFIRGLGEQDAEEKLPEDYFQFSNDWSSDGRFIAITNSGFATDVELKGDVWLIDMTHGRKVVPLVHTPFHEASPAFSPDGRWLAFTSDESGQSEVYIQAFEAGESPRLVGERHVVSRLGGTSLRWARNGRELFYLAWDGGIYAVPISLSPLKIGEAVPLFKIGLEARAAIHSIDGFDVSPDGQRLLVPVVKSPEKSEIVLIQNWEATLTQAKN